MKTSTYGFGIDVPLEHDAAVARAKAALADEGFGILCEIDVAATMKKKLGVEFRSYVILGACNPPLAHRALEAELDVGVFLPCNVVVYADSEPARSVITVMDPVAAFELAGNASLEFIASEVRARLVRALHVIERSTSEFPIGSGP
jgi:uncharacterized protein (DUF302 family)